MARQRQYADPISIPFTFPKKDEILALADENDLAQADVVRMAVDVGLPEVRKRLEQAKK